MSHKMQIGRMNILLVLVVLMCFVNQTFAQEFKNHGGSITVLSTGGIYVNGDIQIIGDAADTAYINNSGSISLTGNFMYDTTGYSRIRTGGAGPRAFKFVDSTGTQKITGFFKGSRDEIYNLVVDKDTSAFVLIESDIEVSGSIVWGNSTISSSYMGDTFDYNMGGGQIHVGINELYLTNSNPASIAGHQTLGTYQTCDRTIVTNELNGGLRREVLKGANYVYPVSRNSRYNPIVLDVLSSSTFSGPSSDVLIRFENTQGATVNYTGFFITSCDTAGRDYNFDCLMTNGIWRIDGSEDGRVFYRPNTYPHSESFANCAPTGGTFKSYRTLRSPSPGGDWTPYVLDSAIVGLSEICNLFNADSTIDLIATAIPGGGYRRFSSLGVGSGDNNSVTPVSLPVELLSLEAYPVDNSFIRVDWSTALEINNAGFYVQRSEDGANWVELGWVEGAGNSTTVQHYSFDDNTPERGINYLYRFKQIDFDGQYAFSPIDDAMLQPLEDKLVIGEFIPNPAPSRSSLNIKAPRDAEIELNLFNAVGQIVRVYDFDLIEGSNTVEVNVNFLASGTYYATIKYGDEVHKRALVVVR